MCGIAGIVGSRADEATIAVMVDVQHHRGPDDRGVWLEPGVALGHDRLSIIDLSRDGHQPMHSADGRYVLVFNGEIYNHLELRRELADYPYRSRTDSEVILAAYRRWGPACVERFNGMFAFAVWDRRTRRLFCARDRLGIKPFHYARHRGAWLFASEIKALLAAGVPARPDADTWAAYLVHGVYDHGPATFFEGVSALPPGTTLTLEEGRETLRTYWDVAVRATAVRDVADREAEEEFLALFDDAVRLRLRADVPVGVNLSGGLDSASLLATMDRVSEGAGALQAFTAAFSDAAYDETDFADRVPRRHAWTRHVRRLGPEEVWRLAEEATWHQEAPFGGIATLAYHHLHGLACEKGVTVLLEGQGVDEMLAGYRYFGPHHHLDLLDAGACRALRAEVRGQVALEGAADRVAARRAAFARMRAARGGGGGPRYQDGTAFLAPEALTPATLARAGPYPGFARPYAERLGNVLYRDLRHTKLPRVLRMNDRLSMAFSRELREPYLDHRIVEFLFSLPGRQKIRAGRPKDLLRRAMASRLPDDVRGAPKRAVVTPQREWLRGPLAPAVEDVLSSRSFAERGLFRPEACREAFARFRAGEGSNAFFVWQWVGTELWFRRFIDQAARLRTGGGRATGIPAGGRASAGAPEPE